jgi:hypothetical protein
MKKNNTANKSAALIVRSSIKAGAKAWGLVVGTL